MLKIKFHLWPPIHEHTHIHIYIYIYIYRKKVSKYVGDHSRGWPEDSLYNSYDTQMYGRALLLSVDCSTLPLIRTLYCWVLSNEVSSTIFKVFGMTQPGIEPRSSASLENTLLTRPMRYEYIWMRIIVPRVYKQSKEIECSIVTSKMPSKYCENVNLLRYCRRWMIQ